MKDSKRNKLLTNKKHTPRSLRCNYHFNQKELWVIDLGIKLKSKQEMKVLFSFYHHLASRRNRGLSASFIGDNVEMERSNVSRIITLLEKRNWLIVTDKGNRFQMIEKTYQLNFEQMYSDYLKYESLSVDSTLKPIESSESFSVESTRNLITSDNIILDNSFSVESTRNLITSDNIILDNSFSVDSTHKDSNCSNDSFSNSSLSCISLSSSSLSLLCVNSTHKLDEPEITLKDTLMGIQQLFKDNQSATGSIEHQQTVDSTSSTNDVKQQIMILEARKKYCLKNGLEKEAEELFYKIQELKPEQPIDPDRYYFLEQMNRRAS